MKKLIMAMLILLPMAVAAQDNTWEQVEVKEKGNPDAKYLAGAVPEVDGHVTFTTTIKAPGKKAKQIYDLLLEDFTKLTKEPNQFEQSRIVIDDAVELQVAHSLCACSLVEQTVEQLLADVLVGISAYGAPFEQIFHLLKTNFPLKICKPLCGWRVLCPCRS